MGTKLTQREAAIVVEVLRRAPVEPRARTFSFDFKDGIGDQTVLSAPVRDQPGMHLVSTLGSNGRDVLVTITDGDDAQIADVLARIEEHAARCQVQPGDTLALDHHYLKQNGRAGVLLVERRVSNALRTFPDALEAGGAAYRCLLVVLLSEAEYRTKTTGGLSALVSRMRSEKKGFVAVRAPAEDG